MNAYTLGTGFFVTRDVVLTCHHVMSPISNPHQNGDSYHLVRNVTGTVDVYEVPNVTAGVELRLFPQADLALLRVTNAPANQDFAALDFGTTAEGSEIGVAGYPLPQLNVTNGVLSYGNLIYRVAKDVLTACYTTNVETPELPNPITVPVLEVNFLFVPGNSGGPIFKAESGAVIGFVHGFNTTKVVESLQQVTMIPSLPLGVSPQYVDAVHALYSLGIRLDCVRPHLQQFGVSV